MPSDPPPVRVTPALLNAYHSASWSSGHVTINGVAYWLTVNGASEWALTTSPDRTIAYGDAYLLHDPGSRANDDGTFQVSGGAALALADAGTSAGVVEW
jgi:hypothetical protein